MLKKRKEKTTFKNEFNEGDKVRIVLTGFIKNQKVNLVIKYIQLRKPEGKQ